MTYHGIISAITTIAVGFTGGALAPQAIAQGNGSAVVAVETVPPGTPGSFQFSGAPTGTVTAGGQIAQSSLEAGHYQSVASGVSPNFTLLSISCDDPDSPAPSSGDLQRRAASFHIDPGETVVCTFVYASKNVSEDGPGTAPPSEPVSPEQPVAPDEPAVPDDPALADEKDCVPPDLVPKAGKWSVNNLAGRMVCGSMIDMPLTPSQETGKLEIRDCGWTVIGTGLEAGTAALTMRAVDRTSGRYAGTVDGVQNGIPMTIEFTWQLNSDEWIVGDLKSQVSQQGMTCHMSRPFEMRYLSP